MEESKVQALQSACVACERTLRNAEQNFADIYEHIKDVAVSLETMDDAEGVKDMHALSEKVLESEEQLRAMKDALHGLGSDLSSSISGVGKIDFQEMLDKKAEELAKQRKNEKKRREPLMDIKQAVWEVKHPNEPFPGLASSKDADVVMATTQYEKIAKNKKCPVSGRNVLELEDPVKDMHGYVYEKSYILQLFQRGSRTIECPVAGTSHQIMRSDLVVAKEVLRAMKRRQATERSRKAVQAMETIID